VRENVYIYIYMYMCVCANERICKGIVLAKVAASSAPVIKKCICLCVCVCERESMCESECMYVYV
jgi:hypothetical protein